MSVGLLYSSVWRVLSSSLRSVSRKCVWVEEVSKVNLMVGCSAFMFVWNFERLRGEWNQMNWMSSIYRTQEPGRIPLFGRAVIVCSMVPMKRFA